MQNLATLARPAPADPLAIAILRLVTVAGCATALIMARYPLPF